MNILYSEMNVCMHYEFMNCECLIVSRLHYLTVLLSLAKSCYRFGDPITLIYQYINLNWSLTNRTNHQSLSLPITRHANRPTPTACNLQQGLYQVPPPQCRPVEWKRTSHRHPSRSKLDCPANVAMAWQRLDWCWANGVGPDVGSIRH